MLKSKAILLSVLFSFMCLFNISCSKQDATKDEDKRKFIFFDNDLIAKQSSIKSVVKMIYIKNSINNFLF